MSNEFRKAELIELHDIAVAVHPGGYADGLVGWAEFSDEDISFLVDGESLDKLLQAMGITSFSVEHYNVKKQRHYSLKLRDMSLPLFQRLRRVVGGSYSAHNIKELFAQVDGPHLLQIRFVGTYEDQQGAIQEYTTELTYSGNYTVWWKSDQ